MYSLLTSITETTLQHGIFYYTVTASNDIICDIKSLRRAIPVGQYLSGQGGGLHENFSEIDFLVVPYRGDQYLSDAFGPMKKYCS